MHAVVLTPLNTLVGTLYIAFISYNKPGVRKIFLKGPDKKKFGPLNSDDATQKHSLTIDK